jgi:hypothetical protein
MANSEGKTRYTTCLNLHCSFILNEVKNPPAQPVEFETARPRKVRQKFISLELKFIKELDKLTLITTCRFSLMPASKQIPVCPFMLTGAQEQTVT